MKGYKKGFTPKMLVEHKKENKEYRKSEMKENIKQAGLKTKALDKAKSPSIDKKEYGSITKALKGAMKD